MLDLGAELLINLFDASGDPVIIRLDTLGEPHNEYNYSTIGTGSAIARAFLSQVDFTDDLTFGQCVYEVLRAKVASERSRDVGRGTSVDVVVSGSRRYSISAKGFKYYQRLLRPYKVPTIEWNPEFIDFDDAPAQEPSPTEIASKDELPSQ
jgi:20S proteasome alpha/beta subunit